MVMFVHMRIQTAMARTAVLGVLTLGGCAPATQTILYCPDTGRSTVLGSDRVLAGDARPNVGNANGTQWDAANPLDTLEGKASYYHASLAGNTTANGEVYDPALLTAASRDLPFGTIVRVTRIDNGKQVTVRVNDRGPFGDKSRILDLSRAAAEQLDMVRAGVVKIRAEVLQVPK